MTHRDHHHSERQNHTARAEPAAVAASPEQTPTPERIRVRAYALSLERRGGPGSPIEDWRRAEAQLREEQQRIDSHQQDR